MYIFLYFLIGLLSAIGVNVYKKNSENFGLTMMTLIGWPLIILVVLLYFLYFNIVKLADLINTKLRK